MESLKSQFKVWSILQVEGMLLDSYVRSILDDHIAKTMTFRTNCAAAFGILVHNIQVN